MTKNLIQHCEPTEIEWPQYHSEQERIKLFSEKFKNTPLEDAFSEVYGVKINITNDEDKDIINSLPREVELGETIAVRILSVGKESIGIDAYNVKENIVCKNNLYKYKKFQSPLHEPIEWSAKVIKKDNKQVIVDIMEPMIDSWKEEIALHPLDQYNVAEDKSTYAVGLKLISGGYLCKVCVPEVSEFIGEDYFIDAFIPGSQIVLNIENDFSRWEGKSVRVFVTNFMPSPSDPSKMVAVCSVKKYLQHIGNVNMINMFKHYTDGVDGTEWWKSFTKQPIGGIVTGVINSSKRCGVFVELPDYHITGMVMLKPQEIVKYAPQMKINVNLTGFDLPTYYNDMVGQVQHGVPYVFNDINPNVLERCDLKPVLTIAD